MGQRQSSQVMDKFSTSGGVSDNTITREEYPVEKQSRNHLYDHQHASITSNNGEHIDDNEIPNLDPISDDEYDSDSTIDKKYHNNIKCTNVKSNPNNKNANANAKANTNVNNNSKPKQQGGRFIKVLEGLINPKLLTPAIPEDASCHDSCDMDFVRRHMALVNHRNKINSRKKELKQEYKKKRRKAIASLSDSVGSSNSSCNNHRKVGVYNIPPRHPQQLKGDRRKSNSMIESNDGFSIENSNTYKQCIVMNKSSSTTKHYRSKNCIAGSTSTNNRLHGRKQPERPDQAVDTNILSQFEELKSMVEAYQTERQNNIQQHRHRNQQQHKQRYHDKQQAKVSSSYQRPPFLVRKVQYEEHQYI